MRAISFHLKISFSQNWFLTVFLVLSLTTIPLSAETRLNRKFNKNLHFSFSDMACLHPNKIKSPETRLLQKYRSLNYSFEVFQRESNERRNLLFDPTPLVTTRADYYTGNFTPRYMEVPCGRCELCNKAKVNSYLIRSHFEYIDCLAKNGVVAFVTLTYFPTKVPIQKGLGVCFDSEHVKNFLKRLRINLQRQYNYTEELRYFIVSEFGGEHGLPHYHGIIYMPYFPAKFSTQYTLWELVSKSWTKVADMDESFGTFWNRQVVDVSLVRSDAAINYVCKYLGKQFGADVFDQQSKLFPYRFRRNHWQSLGYGLCMYDYCNTDIFKKGKIRIGDFDYTIPKYYTNRLRREFAYRDDYTGDYVYYPTDFAYDFSYDSSVRLLSEYKKLSLLNPDFPTPPAILFNPYILELYEKYSVSYTPQGFKLSEPESALFRDFVSALNVYFSDVNNYYASRNKAHAEKLFDNRKKQALARVYGVDKRNI